jgi:hypothetical protein
MIILTNTTDKLQVKQGTGFATAYVKAFASYRETTATDITPKRGTLNILTSYSDLVGSPTASTQRIIDYISIYNNDTINQTITIVFNDNATLYELFVTTLAPGEKIEYQEGLGFKVMTNAGSVKTSVNQGNNTISSSMSAVVLGTDVINTNAIANQIADITGLSFTAGANKTYYFKFIINYTCAVTTTGSRFSISGPASPLSLCFTSEYSLTTTTTTRNATVVTYDLPAAANASSAQLIGNNAIIEGIITTITGGDIIARFASEVAGSPITAKAGSIVYYQQLI